MEPVPQAGQRSPAPRRSERPTNRSPVARPSDFTVARSVLFIVFMILAETII
jgi:hypothetical protein